MAGAAEQRGFLFKMRNEYLEIAEKSQRILLQ